MVPTAITAVSAVRRMRRTTRAAACACALLVAGSSIGGCGLFDDDGQVTVRSDGVRLTIRNGTDERIYYMVFGRGLIPVLDWIPHLDDERSVAAGSSRSIPHDDIMMEEGETQVAFYWWTASVSDGQRVPGTFSSTIIDL